MAIKPNNLLTFLVLLTSLICTGECIKEEIVHQFRQPEARPPAAVTSLFILLVSAPGIVLLKLWAGNVKFDFGPLFSMSRILFHLIFVSILFCYAKFFFGTNMFDTMRLVAPAIPVLMYLTPRK